MGQAWGVGGGAGGSHLRLFLLWGHSQQLLRDLSQWGMADWTQCRQRRSPLCCGSGPKHLVPSVPQDPRESAAELVRRGLTTAPLQCWQ